MIRHRCPMGQNPTARQMMRARCPTTRALTAQIIRNRYPTMKNRTAQLIRRRYPTAFSVAEKKRCKTRVVNHHQTNLPIQNPCSTNIPAGENNAVIEQSDEKNICRFWENMRKSPRNAKRSVGNLQLRVFTK